MYFFFLLRTIIAIAKLYLFGWKKIHIDPKTWMQLLLYLSLSISLSFHNREKTPTCLNIARVCHFLIILFIKYFMEYICHNLAVSIHVRILTVLLFDASIHTTSRSELSAFVILWLWNLQGCPPPPTLPSQKEPAWVCNLAPPYPKPNRHCKIQPNTSNCLINVSLSILIPAFLIPSWNSFFFFYLNKSLIEVHPAQFPASPKNFFFNSSLP